MADTIKLRRDTQANWTSANPVLNEGEPGIETDTLKVKIGDGKKPWNELPYNYYNKSEVDDIIGDINTILDTINGEVI